MYKCIERNTCMHALMAVPKDRWRLSYHHLLLSGVIWSRETVIALTMYDLKDKVVLVTGGAAGIGLSYVKEFLRNGVQAVTIADVNVAKGEEAVKALTQEFGPNKVIFVKTDATDESQLEAAFKTTLDTWKTIDVVINNAGIMNDGHWELEIALNCSAVVRGTILGLRYMGKDKGGKGGVIVNISSILGLQPLPGCPVYVGTKHFVIGFDRSLGTQYHFDRTGVKVQTMCPGVTDTPLISDANKFALADFGSDIGTQLAKELGALPPQPTENVAKGMITLITTGANGSVWLSEGNEPVCELNIPDRQTFKK